MEATLTSVKSRYQSLPRARAGLAASQLGFSNRRVWVNAGSEQARAVEARPKALEQATAS